MTVNKRQAAGTSEGANLSALFAPTSTAIATAFFCLGTFAVPASGSGFTRGSSFTPPIEVQCSRLEEDESSEEPSETVSKRIYRLLYDPLARETDEEAPPGSVCATLISLVEKVHEELGSEVASAGHVSSFYGEVSVTWKAGDYMVAVFVDSEDAFVHYGTLSHEGVGGYKNESLTTPEGQIDPEALVKHLRAMSPLAVPYSLRAGRGF